MSDIFVEETGRTLRVKSGFNMSAYTDLSIIFCKPDMTSVIKTTADGVTLGVVDVNDDDLGLVLANQYVEYPVESGLITDSDAGEWTIQLLYTNTNVTPSDNLYGKTANFTVLERCNT